MSKYEFSVPSYKAINRASIVNEGITVIAGENGSGKSTLSRMMYYTINIMNDFKTYVFRDTLSNVINIARSLFDALLQTTRNFQNRQILRIYYEQLVESSSLENLETNFYTMLKEYAPILNTFFSTENEKSKQDRILHYLGVNTTNHVENLARACMEVAINKFEQEMKMALENIDRHPKPLLLGYIRANGLDLQDFPKDIKFIEDDVDLLTSKFFNKPLSLHRAIYIDTPMAVNDNFNLATRHWTNLVGLMNQETIEGTRDELLLRKKLKNIIHGDVLSEKDEFSQEPELFYKRNDGLKIDLVNAATGYKSFAYLLRLLANGYLKNDTLLLIDEPEAHLHPQWIVEFANILVQLNKVLGVKILVASHNPDMVSAIRTISEAEGVLEKTRFYLAQCSDKDSYKYDYIDLGTEIGPIFKSFNIALNRIEFYGTRSSSL
mgnify:CR=1 FL=1